MSGLRFLAEFESTDAELDGTGFDGTAMGEPVGQATNWLQVRGPAEPGETLDVAIWLFDTSDSIFDTTVLLDNFQWSCAPCTAMNPGDCLGVEPAGPV